jgi:hypothetical protein
MSSYMYYSQVKILVIYVTIQWLFFTSNLSLHRNSLQANLLIGMYVYENDC